MNKLKMWRLLAFVPAIALLAGINYYEDPANIFHDSNKEMAAELLGGKAVYFGSGNGDERKVKQYVIEGMPKHVECLTIGPCLSMTVNKENVGTEDYYNLSVSGLNYTDCMAEFALLDLNEIEYDRVILCVDSYFFDEAFALGSRNQDFIPYAEYMIKKFDGEDPEAPQKSVLTTCKTYFEQAFSLTYFQASLNLIKKNRSLFLKSKRWGIMNDETADYAHYENDASYVYALEYRLNTTDNVVAEATGYDIETEFAHNKHLSDYYKDRFRMLIEYLDNKGVEIEFFYCPICPTLWDRRAKNADEYFLLEEIEAYGHEIAAEYNIKETGSFNPYNIGITDDDFWDARHLKQSSIDEKFDFKKR